MICNDCGLEFTDYGEKITPKVVDLGKDVEIYFNDSLRIINLCENCHAKRKLNS